jgi:hypothetical protein
MSNWCNVPIVSVSSIILKNELFEDNKFYLNIDGRSRPDDRWILDSMGLEESPNTTGQGAP